jgi:hypothetical protein
MCVVVPAAGLIAGQVAQGALGYIGARQQAASQQDYNNQVYNQQARQAEAEQGYQNQQVSQQNQYILDNAANAEQALYSDRAALASQGRQEALAIALDTQQKRIEALRARGSIQASERNGNTLETLMGDFYRQEAQYNFISNQNLQFSDDQRALENQKLSTVARSRINEARPYIASPVAKPSAVQRVSKPSFLGALLSTGSEVAGTVSSRSVYDPYTGRYRIARAQVASRTPAPYAVPSRSYATGVTDYTGRTTKGSK